jgi:hypothetical protein
MAQTSNSPAWNADKYVLYEAAVQSPEIEIEFIDRVYRRLKNARPLILREDFCGTGYLACTWARSRADRVALGLDLDPAPLAWGAKHHLARLTDAQKPRVRLHRADVLKPPAGLPKADVIAALNFSYFIFKRRETLLAYFRRALAGLARDGLLVMDLVGGSECYQDGFSDRTRRSAGRGKPFTFVWEHARYEPISGRMLCHIHFEFPNRRRFARAFTYDWRLWSLPELQDLLREAGFRRVHVYWEGEDARGRGNGVFRPSRTGSADRSFVAYLVAER